MGPKKLWVWPPGERAQTEVLATCVLDFYVHESIQRHGVGRQLFEVRIDMYIPSGVIAYVVKSFESEDVTQSISRLQ